MVAKLSKKCSSTWWAAAPAVRGTRCRGRGRRREQRFQNLRRGACAAAAVRAWRFASPHRRARPPLYVSLAQLRHQAGRADLLALPANAHLGFLAEISRRHHEPAGAGRRRADRRRAALGHSVSLEDRLLHHLQRRNVVAQSREPADEPALSFRARRRLERMERDQARRQHDPRRRRSLFHLRLRPARSWGGTRRLLRGARADELVARAALRRRDPALLARRRGACLVARFHPLAALLRLLPGIGVAGLAEAAL